MDAAATGEAHSAINYDEAGAHHMSQRNLKNAAVATPEDELSLSDTFTNKKLTTHQQQEFLSCLFSRRRQHQSRVTLRRTQAQRQLAKRARFFHCLAKKILPVRLQLLQRFHSKLLLSSKHFLFFAHVFREQLCEPLFPPLVLRPSIVHRRLYDNRERRMI